MVPAGTLEIVAVMVSIFTAILAAVGGLAPDLRRSLAYWLLVAGFSQLSALMGVLLLGYRLHEPQFNLQTWSGGLPTFLTLLWIVVGVTILAVIGSGASTAS